MTQIERSPLLLLGPTSLLFVGALERGSWHAHAATVCVLGLDQPIKILLQGEDDWQESRVAVIPAGVSHCLDPSGGRCAVIYGEVYAPTWQAMAPQVDQRLRTELPHLATLRSTLLNIHDGELSSDDLQQLKQALDAALGVPCAEPVRVLPAVHHMMACLEQDVECSLEDLANQMNLSASRVQRLFLEELGVGYKKLQLWLRFRSAAQQIAFGRNVTDAALAGGFANSSHFSHSFRAMFGVSTRHALVSPQALRFAPTDW